MRRAFSWLAGAAVVAYFALGLIFLALRYAVLPQIDHYKPDIERIASQALGNRVTISGLAASWRGLQPHLDLRDVAVHDERGAAALRLPRLSATVSWWSVPALGLRLDRLEVIGPDLQARRDRQGNLHVGGIRIAPDAQGDGKGADWILSQHRVAIRDATLRWTDELRGAPQLVLRDVQLLARNRWTHHQVAVQAVPPEGYAEPLDVRADFHHSPFARRISDASRWNGLVYFHVAQADLAVWNAFLDYPLALSRGRGGIRAWLEVRQARIVDMLVDLALDDVGVRLAADLPRLDLARLDGRLAASETGGSPGTFAFGRNGHRIELSDLSLRTRSGLTLESATLSERYRPESARSPASTELTASRLDLRTLAELAAHVPLPQDLRGKLKALSPGGQVQDLTMQWEGEADSVRQYRARGRFEELAVGHAAPASAKETGEERNAQDPLPGFRNLTGSFDLNEAGGRVTVTGHDATLLLPGVLRNPAVNLEALDALVRWSFPASDQVLLQIDRFAARQSGTRASLSGTVRLPRSAADRAGSVVTDLSGDIDAIGLTRVGALLPAAMPEDLQAWLASALRGGTAENVAWRLKGDLAHFPFRRGSSGRTAAGEFAVSGKIVRGAFHFAPDADEQDGRPVRWPAIDQIDGRFKFDRARMEIVADKADTHGVSLSRVQAVLPDLLADDRTLAIQGVGSGSLERFIDYVRVTPLSGWTGQFLNTAEASGPARLDLKLQLPLKRLKESKVEGGLQLAGNRIRLSEILPPLTAASGRIDFHEKGFQLANVHAGFLGGPVAVAGGSRADGKIAVRADGRVTLDGIRAEYASPAMRRLFDRLSGETQYATTILVENGNPAVSVRSDLRGVGINLPAPLNKTAGVDLPLTVDLIGRPADDQVDRDELRIALGTGIEARYRREKRRATERAAKDANRKAGAEPEWRVVGGGIGVNQPAPLADGGVIANVNMPSLNIDEWRAVVASLGADDVGDEPEPAHAVAAVTVRETPIAGPAPEDNAFAQYVEPTVLAARAGELIVMGKKLDKVVVGASRDNRVWQANIDSVQAAGYVTWAESRSGRGPGKVTARLARLDIPETAASGVADLLNDDSETARIPGLDIFAEDFRLFGKQFGKLDLAASNARGTRGREWRIDRLQIVNSDATLKASGRWLAGAKHGISSLDYQLDIVDGGHLLDRLGFPGILEGASGKLEGGLSWQGMPFSFDIPSLAGSIKLDIRDGQFLKVEPGAAKLLGVLSLQTLPRRLVLDFRDVFSEGFAFDGIVGSASIQQGKAVTDNLKMRSVNATVLMDGTADIGRETQDLHVAVIPKINAGAASLVYGLAVNPVVGVGTFLAQLFLRDPLSRAFTFEYRITGPWKDPVVTKLPRGTNATDEQAPERNPPDRKTG